jgi:Thioredoxin.
MRKFLYLLIPLLFVALPLVSHAEKDSVAAKPAVYAVMMHADWCGACKALDPKVTQARVEAKLDDKDVLFVTFDLTDDMTKAQSAMMAASMGITEVYESNAGKTGFMLLVNAESGDKLARVTNKLKADEIADRILASLKTVKS